MAKIDISDLKNKQEGVEGANGQLSADDFNRVVSAVMGNQDDISKSVKTVTINGSERKFGVDSEGNINIEIVESGYSVKLLEQSLSGISAEGIYYIGSGDSLVFTAKLSQTYSASGEEPVPVSTPCRIYFLRNDAVVNTTTAKDGDTIEFDFGPYVSGSSENILMVKVDNLQGTVVTSQPFVAKILTLRLTTNVYDSIRFKSGIGTKNPWTLTTGVTGASAYVYAFVDGESVKKDLSTGEPTSLNADRPLNSGESLDTSVEIGLEHGSHVLEIYAESSTTKGIKTATQKYNFLYIDESSTAPILDTSFKAGSSVKVYNTITVPYWIYYTEVAGTSYNGDLKAKVYLDINAIDNTLGGTGKPYGAKYISETTISCIDSFYSGSYSVAIAEKNYQGTASAVIEIYTADDVLVASKEILFNIAAPDVELSEVGGYKIKLSAEGRTNGDTNKNEWKSGDYEVVLPEDLEFTATGSGWNKDENNNSVLRLRKGRRAYLNYKPFASEVCFPGQPANDKALGNNGLTISLILKPFNASNKNSVVVRCRDSETTIVDDQEITTYKNAGFDITANSVSLYSKDKYIYCDYRENERVQVDLVVEGGDYRYRRYAQENGQIEKSLIESEECYSRIYINGVYQQLLYNELGSGYLQVNPMFIEFGSDECDLDIYEIRVYDKALNIRDILTNYSFNAPTVEEKIARLQRNDLFSDTDGYSVIDPNDGVEYYPMPLFNIEREKLAKARPELPIWTVEMEYLPIDKGSDGRINVESTTYENPKNDGSTDDLVAQGNYSFESGIPVDGHYNRMSCQGSSSMNYPLPYRNWDWRTGDKEKSGGNGKSVFRLSNGEELKKYSMYPSMPGIEKITLKKDYASSEMVNNAVCSDIYNDMAYSIGGSYPNVKSPAQNFLPNAEKYKLALKAIPIFMYREWEGKEEALGMMNFIPNKNEVDYLGFTSDDNFNFTYDEDTVGKGSTLYPEDGFDPRTPRAQSWEIVNNHVFWDIPLDEASWDPVNNVIYNPTTQENESSIKPGVYADAYYEARYPTDSSTGGDYGMGETEAHVPMVNYETELIRDFHNWMCSCNLETATNEALEKPYTAENGVVYTTDSIEYRKAKFSKEAPDRLILDQWILYYVWREQFWMYDSGSKNLQIYTMGRQRHTEDGNYPNDAVNFYTGEDLRAAEYKRGWEDLTKPYQWGCMVRDADTALGINNIGELQFPPYLEDTDLMVTATSKNPMSSIEYHYDVYPYGGEAKYSELLGEGSIYSGVMNGQHGAAWRLLPVCFSGRINEIYKALYVAASNKNNSSNFSYETAAKKFNDHQDKWSEGLYNFGSQQYFGGAAFTKWYTAGCGNKRSQRDSWLYSGFRYRNSKYKVELNNNVITLRPQGRFNACDLNINTYLPLYITGAEGGLANVYKRHIDISKCTSFYFPGMNTESDTKLLNADLITELPDFYKLGDFLTLDLTYARRLKVLRLGNILDDHRTTRRYGLTTLSIGKGSCESLEILDVSDMINLTACGGLADQLNLKEFYAVHSGLKTVVLPESSSLSIVHLGSDVDPGEGSSAGLPNGCPIETLTAKNLVGLKEFKLIGNSAPALKVLTIDNSNNQTLYELAIYAAGNRIDGKDIKILNTNWPLAKWYSSDVTIKRDLTTLADPSVKFTRTTIDLGTKASNLDYSTKELLASKFGDIDSSTNSLYVKYAPYNAKSIIIDTPNTIYCGDPEETYQLPFKMSSTDFTAYKLKRSADGVYRPAVKWEFVDNRDNDYAELTEDGSLKLKADAIGDNKISIQLKVSVELLEGFDEVAKEKTVTCNLFYHEAKPGDVVYADGTFESDPSVRNDTPIGVCYWAEEGNKGHGLMMALNSIDTGDYISVQKYTLPCGSTPTTPDMDFNITGSDGDKYYIVKNLEYTTINYYEDKYTTYENYIDPLNSYKFALNPKEGGDLIKQVGYTKVLTNDEAAYLNDNLGTSYVEGDKLPQGKYNTLVTIIHRDTVLSDNDIIGDEILRAPKKTFQYTEMEDLMNTLGKIYSHRNNTSSMYYQSERLLYPYTSACYSYNPQGKRAGVNETVVEEFREGKWWQPGVGELFRIQFYLTEASKGNIVGDKTIDPTIAESIEKFKNLLSNPYFFIGLPTRGNSYTVTSDGNKAASTHSTYNYAYGVNAVKPSGNSAGATQFVDKNPGAPALSTNIAGAPYAIVCCEF